MENWLITWRNTQIDEIEKISSVYVVWKGIILLVECHGTNFTFSKSPFQKSEVHTTKKTRTLQLQRTSWSGLDLQIAFRESSKLLPTRRSYSDSTHCWHDKFNFEIYFYAGVAWRKCTIMYSCKKIPTTWIQIYRQN